MHTTKRILRFTSSIIAIFIYSISFAQQTGTVVEGVAAVVGANIVLKSEVDLQYEGYLRQGTIAPGFSKCQVLEELLFQKLLVHHAELDSIEVSDDEVDGNMDRRLQQLIAQMGGDSKKLEEYYNKSIIEIKEEMRPLMKDQLTAQRMQYLITEGMEITPTEVQEFYNKIPLDSLPLINTEVEMSQIVKYPEVSKEAELATIEKLEGLKERIENGSSFASMAIIYSEDPGSSKNGGEYKGIKRGQFVKEFEAVAFNLQKNEVSDPVKTEFGYHIIQLLEKRGEELDLRHILIKPKLEQEDLDEAESFLDSILVAINAGELTWDEAAKNFSEDKETKFNGGSLSNLETGNAKFELSELDRFMYNAVKDLLPNQISDPVFFRDNMDKEAFRLVRLDKKVEPHKANLEEDYQRIKGFALQKKQAEAVQDWIKEKAGETYIKITPSYFPDCQVNELWINKNTSGL